MDSNYNELQQQQLSNIQKEIEAHKQNFSEIGEDVVSQFRGDIIHSMVFIEDQIENIICDHFCFNNEELRKEFTHVILAKESFGLSFKFDVLIFIIKNHYPEFLSTHSHFVKLFEKNLSLRNICAHRKFFSTDEKAFNDSMKEKKHIFYFQNYKTEKSKIKTEYIPITHEIITDCLVDMLNLTEIISQLSAIVFQKNLSKLKKESGKD